jgi:hypothetical protein
LKGKGEKGRGGERVRESKGREGERKRRGRGEKGLEAYKEEGEGLPVASDVALKLMYIRNYLFKY